MRRSWVMGKRLAVLAGVIAGVSLCGVDNTFGGEGATGPDLSGVVQDQDGNPIYHATVFIYTAAPKQGTGILCPSCYADCRKRASTDEKGGFRIESLDPNLLFRVLVVAKGFRPEFASKIDPATKPLPITLQVRSEEASPTQQIKGRVLDTGGKPVSGAVVSIRGVTRGEMTRFGGNEDVDQMAVSDDNGNFAITGETSFDAVGVEVEARAYAKGIFPHLTTGGKVHELKLTEGASVKGQLFKNGQPLAGVEMGISGAEREASVFVGDFSVGTDHDGRFALVNLPPNRDYTLYAKMSSLGAKGAAPARRVRVNEDGSLVDVGQIQVGPGFKLEGRVKLTDGRPVPPKTRVLLSRDEAWDSAEAEADSQGRFKFLGVPAETINVSARLRGYHLSSHNKSLDQMNPFHLVGVLTAEKTDLVLEFEPGSTGPRAPGDYVDLRQDPLIGAEAAKGKPGDVHVTGTVIDAETRKPLSAFTLTEGRAEPYGENIQWLANRQTEITNGQLDLFLNQGHAAPALMVEAEGYLPQSSLPIKEAETNLTFVLKKGLGPNGVVLAPDGKPVADVKVYLADMRNGVYVQDKHMEVRDQIYRGTRSTETDEQGRFKFKPRADDYAILVLAEEGFAQVTVPDLARNPELKLEPWARVEGTLLIGSRPGTNEEIRLSLAQVPYEYHPRNFPPLSLFLQTVTDGQGRFAFERVPPLNIEVYHSPKVKDEKMGLTPMSQTMKFSLGPGEVKKLTLGGQGRPVTGQLIVRDYPGTINWRADVQTIDLILPPRDDVPDLVSLSQDQAAKIRAAESNEEKKRLMDAMQKNREASIAKDRAFYATAKGHEYAFRNKRYALSFGPDGRFRIEDVPGGKYRLHVDLREGAEGPMRFSAPRIASLDKEFEVPDSPGGRSDEAFDLGQIEMQARKNVGVGQAAPEFEVKTVDGGTIKLSDCAGKYVLLDFWAVWCGPCVAETPHLKAAYEAFKADGRFRMIGLSLDPDIKTPRDYASKNGLGWTMGFLGDWSKAELPNKYGVEGIPSIFLIGPDGKIIAKELRGENIKAGVERALAHSSHD